MSGHPDDSILNAELAPWDHDPETADFLAWLDVWHDLPWDYYPGPGRWSREAPAIVPEPPCRECARKALAALD